MYMASITVSSSCHYSLVYSKTSKMSLLSILTRRCFSQVIIMNDCQRDWFRKFLNLLKMYFNFESDHSHATCGEDKGPSIYDVHTEGEVVRLRWTHVDGGRGSSPMWTSTQKIKIRVH